MGQPGHGLRLPQPGQLTIGDELLGYHNNNILKWCLKYEVKVDWADKKEWDIGSRDKHS